MKFRNNLKYGMLIGAFDNATNLYGRGYVTLVAGNSVNVALSDYGRVINTTKLRALPTKYTQLPAYAFKVHTKGDYVPQLKVRLKLFLVLIRNFVISYLFFVLENILYFQSV